MPRHLRLAQPFLASPVAASARLSLSSALLLLLRRRHQQVRLRHASSLPIVAAAPRREHFDVPCRSNGSITIEYVQFSSSSPDCLSLIVILHIPFFCTHPAISACSQLGQPLTATSTSTRCAVMSQQHRVKPIVEMKLDQCISLCSKQAILEQTSALNQHLKRHA